MPIHTNGKQDPVKVARRDFMATHAAANSVPALKEAVLMLARRVAELEAKLLGENHFTEQPK